jgi:hypothetical protein
MQGIFVLYLTVGFSVVVGLFAGHGLSQFFPDLWWLNGLLTGAVIGAMAFYTLAFVISFQKAHIENQRGPVVFAQALLLAVNWGLPAVIMASALAGISIYAALGGMIGSVTPPFARGQTPKQSTSGALTGSAAGAVVHLIKYFLF